MVCKQPIMRPAPLKNQLSNTGKEDAPILTIFGREIQSGKRENHRLRPLWGVIRLWHQSPMQPYRAGSHCLLLRPRAHCESLNHTPADFRATHSGLCQSRPSPAITQHPRQNSPSSASASASSSSYRFQG